MLRAILSGATGAMGQVIAHSANQNQIAIVAGIDKIPKQLSLEFPLYSRFTEVSEQVDVIIDFSHPSVLPALLDYAVEHKIPAVIATTGMSEHHLTLIEQAGKSIPIFFSFNMSLGINLLSEIAEKLASALGDRYDIEIIEKHHNQKIDAPSGTALMIAQAVAKGLSYSPNYIYERHSLHQKRGAFEVGIHSVRGGTIAGEHEVMFAGCDEIITISHSARSKDIYATGAFRAVHFIVAQKEGLYTMKHIL